MVEKKDKVLNVRLPKKLYEEIKMKHPLDSSEALRKHLQEIVDRDEKLEKQFHFCSSCKKQQDIIFISQGLLIQDGAVYFIYCWECIKQLRDPEVKKFLEKQTNLTDVDQHILILLKLFSYSETDSLHMIPGLIKLIQRFPFRWSISKGIVNTTNKNNDEMGRDLNEINQKIDIITKNA